MKDLRTLLPSVARSELKAEILAILNQVHKDIDLRSPTYVGELKTIAKIRTKHALEDKHPYVADISMFGEWFNECYKMAEDEFRHVVN